MVDVYDHPWIEVVPGGQVAIEVIPGGNTITVLAGHQGPPGPPGLMGPPGQGLDIDYENLAAGDLIGYGSGYWTNIRQISVTDGGNF